MCVGEGGERDFEKEEEEEEVGEDKDCYNRLSISRCYQKRTTRHGGGGIGKTTQK